MFLYLMSLISVLVQVSFATVATAAGMYYLAELVEEYTVVAKKVITWMVITTTIFHLGILAFEQFPLSVSVCGLAAQANHFVLLKDFPYVSPLSASFVIAIVLLIVNHWLVFQHFGTIYYPFTEVLAYFTLCLWLVPFAFFISLSANDNVLPTTNNANSNDDDVVSNYFSRRGKKYGLLSFFTYVKDTLLPGRGKKTF